MAAKVFLALCASALIVNVISGQCAGNGVSTGVIEIANIGIAGNGLPSGCSSSNLGWGVNGLGLGANGLGLSANGLALGANGLALGTNGLGLGANCLGLGTNGLSPANLASSSGGSFTVSSSSPIAPSGLSVVSDNDLEGPLSVSGGLPFLSAVGVEGQVPALGASDVSYTCGNGNVGIISETVVANAGIASGLGAGRGIGFPGARFVYGSPLAAGGFGNNFGAIGAPGCGASY